MSDFFTPGANVYFQIDLINWIEFGKDNQTARAQLAGSSGSGSREYIFESPLAESLYKLVLAREDFILIKNGAVALNAKAIARADFDENKSFARINLASTDESGNFPTLELTGEDASNLFLRLDEFCRP